MKDLLKILLVLLCRYIWGAFTYGWMCFECIVWSACVCVCFSSLLKTMLDMIDRFQVTRVCRFAAFATSNQLLQQAQSFYGKYEFQHNFISLTCVNFESHCINHTWNSPKLPAISFKYIIQNGTQMNYLYRNITFISLIKTIIFNYFPYWDHYTLFETMRVLCLPYAHFGRCFILSENY